MTTVTIHAAKTHLSALVDAVERLGESVVICRHKQAVAQIVPIRRGRRTGVHANLRKITIKCDPTDPTEKEWNNA